jgi:hypothetical protein
LVLKVLTKGQEQFSLLQLSETIFFFFETITLSFKPPPGGEITRVTVTYRRKKKKWLDREEKIINITCLIVITYYKSKQV